ncbi:MAG: sulfotransferase [Pseudomonadota bacterium]
MTVAALLLGLVAFIAVLRVGRAKDIASDVIGTTQTAMSVMADGDLADDEKETRVRHASLSLLASFFKIAAIAVAALVTSGALVWGGSVLGLYALDRAVDIAMGWPFILGSSAAAVALWLLLDRLNPVDDAGHDDVPYGPLDKALHDFAFASLDRQKRLGDLETRLFRHRIDAAHAARPVFITSLPRAGTTIMLEMLADLPDFASATYRHMPFTLSPLLWGGFSGRFRKAGEKAERAHGDGIEVGFDSPEAFEEMLWMAFWSDHYGTAQIRPWTPDERVAEFETFFRTHMAKIVATKPGATRYLSKNNANIARLGLLARIFPDASIVLPIRNPRAQVRSLLRQHRRFADLHGREPFARRYMEGIGHLEFGGALRPIAFGGAAPDVAEAGDVAFWLRYWIAAYEHVLAQAGPAAIFVDHDALSAAPDEHLPMLAERIGLPDRRALDASAGIFRAPRPAPTLPNAPPALLDQADALHAALLRRCHVPTSNRRSETLV